jgi:anti-anti-sigma factor
MSTSVHVTKNGDLVTIQIAGQFSFPVYQQFRDAYMQCGTAKRYVIDLRGTEYMDSSALGMLLVLREHAGGDVAEIRIVNCGPEVRGILQAAHFEKLFNIS